MKKVLFSFLMMIFLVGCAASKPLKAPCSHSGWPCGQKLKINQDI